MNDVSCHHASCSIGHCTHTEVGWLVLNDTFSTNRLFVYSFIKNVDISQRVNIQVKEGR